MLGRGGPKHWWEKLQSVITLMRPFSDAIHQIEADKPLLSQMLPIWKSLREHVDKWAIQSQAVFGKTVGLEVIKMFNNRFEKHYQPEMSAAYVVDPINFVEDESGHLRPDFDGLDKDQEEHVIQVVMRLNGLDPSNLEARDAVTKEYEFLEFGLWDTKGAVTSGWR